METDLIIKLSSETGDEGSPLVRGSEVGGLFATQAQRGQFSPRRTGIWGPSHAPMQSVFYVYRGHFLKEAGASMPGGGEQPWACSLFRKSQ